MKKIVLLLVFSVCNCFAQNKELNQLFFDIPLHSSRDSIYHFCDNAVFITKEINRYKVTKSGEEIKTFSGFHNKIETVDAKLDSIKFQLSTGSQSVSDKEGYRSLLVFFLDYIIATKKYTQKKYTELKKQLDAIIKKESFGSVIYNEYHDKVGRIDHWDLGDHILFTISYEILENKNYQLRVEYNRYE